MPSGSRTPAIALGLSVAGVVLSPALIGAPIGLAGAVVGGVWLLRRRTPRGLAAASVAVGLAAALFATMFLGFYWFVQTMSRRMSGSDFAEWRGRPAPAVEVTLLDGGTMSIGEGSAGPRTLVVFWATWCGPCRSEIPDLNRLQEELGERIRVVAISDEPEARLDAFRITHGIQYPIASARGLPPPFGDVTAIPTTFVLDSTGTIEEVLVGYQGYDPLLAAANGPTATESG